VEGVKFLTGLKYLSITCGNAQAIAVSQGIRLWFFTRGSIYAISAYMLSPVRPSVCHTGGSVKNGWS